MLFIYYDVNTREVIKKIEAEKLSEADLIFGKVPSQVSVTVDKWNLIPPYKVT